MKLMDAIEKSTSAEPTAVRRYGAGWCKIRVRDADAFEIELFDSSKGRRQNPPYLVDKFELAAALVRLRLDPRFWWDPVHDETVDERYG